MKANLAKEDYLSGFRETVKKIFESHRLWIKSKFIPVAMLLPPPGCEKCINLITTPSAGRGNRLSYDCRYKTNCKRQNWRFEDGDG
jgi:hypothetical protein